MKLAPGFFMLELVPWIFGRRCWRWYLIHPSLLCSSLILELSYLDLFLSPWCGSIWISTFRFVFLFTQWMLLFCDTQCCFFVCLGVILHGVLNYDCVGFSAEFSTLNSTALLQHHGVFVDCQVK